MLDTHSLLKRAEFLRQQKRYKEAEQELKYILEADPQNADALTVLGHIKLDLRDYDAAISILKNCLQYGSSKDYVFYLLSFVYYQKNDNKTALQYLKEALAIFPFNAGYFSLLSHIYLEEKNYTAALEAANQGLEADAENIACLNARSTALFRLNKKEEAYETINDALQIDPESYQTHTNYGWHFLEKGKHKDAAKHFREALRINPNYAYAKQGYKSALKSKLIFYRWLLRGNLWMNQQKRNIRIGLLLGIWVLVKLFDVIGENNSQFKYLGLTMVLLYFSIAIFSWLGNSLANLFLLATPHGKFILNHNEIWSARLVGISLSLALICFASIYNLGEKFEYIPLLIAGFAIAFNEMEYPIKFQRKNDGRQTTAQIILALGFLSCIVSPFSLQISIFFAIIYGFFLLGFIWSGSMRNTI